MTVSINNGFSFICFLKFKFIYFNWRLITLQYCIGFAIHQHESAMGCTRVPHPEYPLLPPSLYHPFGSSQSTSPKHPVSCIKSALIWYYTCFSAILPNHPTLFLSQSPKDCSIHLCLFCCLANRVIVTIFLNSIYMH